MTQISDERPYISYYLKKLNNRVQLCLSSAYRNNSFRDCTMLNMWICDYLYDHRDYVICQKDVEKEFSINRATASKILALMEEKDLIRRESSPYDARRKSLVLLDKGFELHEHSLLVRAEIEHQLCSSLSPQEVRSFKKMCQKILDSLSENVI